ncbi:MAG: hypothetical protein A2Z99_04250 [Treponema sp. GWB1_62_6]|nr:MAG: hypothetical protein A2001_13325 [Treponema sp. GWC1_61_84]OHE68325.1 MAG: hypothetical protein A2Z99_04250 [Treponema sp. GWB1_62_6]OHE69534.1 MAG: hypothetical protein A2413_01545 [Treponema sp. RIFOXYC1_FULL_61_9]HCM27197.1 hypothetical protein [Treponema sp.]
MKFEDIVDYLRGRSDLSEWTYESGREKARESFFTGSRLDMARSKDVERGSLVVHVDARQTSGERGRGSALVSVPASADRAELAAITDRAVERARVSVGPAWSLAEASVPDVPTEGKRMPSGRGDPVAAGLASDPAAAGLAAESVRAAIFAAEAEAQARGAGGPSARVTRSARFAATEIFITERECRLENSRGDRYEWNDALIETEMATSCAGAGGNDDVELVGSWSARIDSLQSFDHVAVEIAREASELLALTRDRADAVSLPELPNLPVALGGEAVAEFFSHFFYRAGAAQVRMGISDARVGGPIGPYALGGDSPTIGFDPSMPGSPADRPADADGFPLRRTVLVENGIVRALEGPCRHAAALALAPVGSCSSLWVAPGSLREEELHAMPRLEALVFSDFFMDQASGEFGGELRLGILHQGGKRTPVTGGSISGSIAAEAANLRFSAERRRYGSFLGPLFVLLAQARIARAD